MRVGRGEGTKVVVEVVIEDYQSEWVRQYEREEEKIRLALHDKHIVIEHIGSTSVLGLPAKPIIDIAVGVHELIEADAFIESLGSIGYEYVPKLGLPNRRFFRKGEWRKGTHHVHVYSVNSEEWSNNLLFRNYLRTHPEKVEEYAQLKRRLASIYSEDRTTYTNLKAPFIQSVIELAKRNT
jgi:GrpB-like predicted nucleotidyltransferase (UPF0157 family)